MDLARGSAAYRRGIYWLCDEAEFARPRGNIGLRGTQLRAIKDVERFRPELQLIALGEGDALRGAKINLPKAWSAKDVSTGVSECPCGRSSECGEVNPIRSG